MDCIWVIIAESDCEPAMTVDNITSAKRRRYKNRSPRIEKSRLFFHFNSISIPLVRYRVTVNLLPTYSVRLKMLGRR
jgi:hypothetical protein